MKDVLILLASTFENRLSSGAHYALGLARAHGARLSVLIAEIDPINLSPEPDTTQVCNTGVKLPSLAERMARTAELVLSSAKAMDVSCEIVATDGEFRSLRERVIYLSQVRDVLIVDAYGPLESPRKDLVDGALFGSGRPLVLVPQGARVFAAERIVIAWDATRSAVRAVHDALPLLVRASDVTVVSVVDDKTILTPDRGKALCRYLALWNIAAKFEPIQSENLAVGTALAAYTRWIEANLLVMGGFAHGIERELMLGSATRDIYRASLETPVLLSH
jgi:nucleotide-binding universal stress UspA family protein